MDKHLPMTPHNIDAYIESIKLSKPPFLCPFDGCLKKYRKFETFQQHLHSEHSASLPADHKNNDAKESNSNDQPSMNLENSTRRSRKPNAEPMPVVEDKGKHIEFKYNNEVHTLNVNTPLPVSIVKSLKKSTKNPQDRKDLSSSAHSSKTITKAKGKSRPTKAKLSNPQAKLNLKLPEPVFCIIDANKVEYKEPLDTNSAYFRYLDSSLEDDEQSKIDYDMDEEDWLWLEQINRKRKNKRLLDVTPDVFELLMDRLEKESFFQSQYNGNDEAIAIDEDAVCCICNDGECQNSNAILFCDMCNLAVHQECYGVPYVPEGQWLCRRCMHSPSRAVDCVLCPKKGGAFKQTDDNQWAHVICAIWIPEVCFANTVFLEPIDSIAAIPQARWKLNCYICGIRNNGACIQCHKSNCYLAFHVTCAQQAGLYMKMEAVKERTSQGLTPMVKKTAYCYNHAPVSASGAQLYSSSDEVDGKSSDLKRKQSNVKDSKVLNCTSKTNANDCRISERSFIPVVSIPTIPIERLSKISELVSFPRRNKFLLRLYAYWKLKRQSRNGVPLLRRLHNNNVTMKMDGERDKFNKRDNKRMVKDMKLLRRDFEHLRLLLEQVKKRERLKLKIIKESKMATAMKLAPFRSFLLTILDRVVEKDTNGFFLEAVNVEDVPDYRTFINDPMDLGTMRKKVEDFEYSNFDSFQQDLYLIVNNCKFYNEKETIWHKAAIKLETFIDSILEENRAYLANFDQTTGMHAGDLL